MIEENLFESENNSNLLTPLIEERMEANPNKTNLNSILIFFLIYSQ